MDFPSDAATNVYKLEDISEIYYFVYTTKSLAEQGFSAEYDNLDVNNAENEAISKACIILEESSCKLRKIGCHVYYDPGDLIFWLFRVPISDSANDDKFEELRMGIEEACGLCGISQFALGYEDFTNGMKEKLQGIIDPADFPRSRHVSMSAPTNSPSQGLSALEAYQRANFQAFASNEFLRNWKELQSVEKLEIFASKANGIDRGDIHLKFVAAISKSVLCNMSHTARCFPLGSCTYIRTPAPVEHLSEDIRGYSETSYVMKLAIDWQISGTVMILAHVCSSPHIRQLSDANISIPEHLGSDVVTAPSGLIATLIGDDVVPSADQIQLSTGRLSQLDAPIPANSSWVRLRLFGEVEPAVIAWPSHLCFLNVQKRSKSGPPDSFFEFVANATAMDPLSKVEQWYAKRTSRADAVAAFEQNQCATSQSQERVEESADEDDILGDVAYNNYQPFQQDMSGVYPTPPDGPTVHPNSLPTIHSQQVAEGAADATSTANSIRPGTSSFVNTPQGNGLPSQNRTDDGDLFGDMDTDFFAANDLTEADFNFFDEPSDDDQEHLDTMQKTTATTDTSPQEKLGSDASEVAIDSEGLQQPDTPILALSRANDHPNSADKDITSTTPEATRASENNQVEVNPEDNNPVESPIPPKPLIDVHHFDLTTPDNIANFTALEDRRRFFEPVPLKASIRYFDSKYTDKGRFHFDHIDRPIGMDPREPQSQVQREVPRLSGQHSSQDKVHEFSDDDDIADGHISQLLETDSERDRTQVPSTQRLPGPHSEPALKRKRENADESVHQVPSPAPFSATDSAREDHETLAYSLMNNTLTQHPGYDCETFLKTSAYKYRKSQPTFENLGESEFLRIAQILADQIILHNHNLIMTSKSLSAYLSAISLISNEPVQPSLHSSISQVLPGVVQCDLKQFSAIGENLSLESSQEAQEPQRSDSKQSSFPWQVNGQMDESNRIFTINTSLVSVRRANAPIDLSPSALAFWEELGLEPISSAKDIIAVCLCPASSFLEERLVTFLDAVASAYHACKLGVHKLYTENGQTSGICRINVENLKGFDEFMNAIDNACERLGQLLSKSSATGGTFVIYIVDMFADASALPRICQAFLKLVDTYASSVKEQLLESPNDLVLQIIPVDMFASTESFIILEPKAHRNFALEVYNRCPPNPHSMQASPFVCAPATHLAKSVPRNINLKVTSNNSHGLPYTDRCIHLCYCYSAQSDWLTASWTDNYGYLQWNAAYFLGDQASDSDEQWPTFEDVARTIWDVTMDMAQFTNTPYRVFIVKNDSLTQDELAAWLVLFNQHQSTVLPTLLTIDETPLLELSTKFAVPITATMASETPVMTHVSPEQPSNAATPAATATAANAATPTTAPFESDAEARLIDVTDETWGVITASKSEDIEADLISNTPLLSGYLVKRLGSRNEEGLLICGVHLIYAEEATETLLKEVLGMYRCLGLLARTRSIVDPVRSILPWHVAASTKALAVLEATMCWRHS